MLEKLNSLKIEKEKRNQIFGGSIAGANAAVRVRGSMVLTNGNTEPLFVIDGVIVDEDNFRQKK